jgi:8-oxo-dGTP pyrophosphatase MutT (NUDIX family)
VGSSEPRDELHRLLARHTLDSPPAGAAGAAVLIVLRAGRSDVGVLLIERSIRRDDPASGQVGLPGGHVEPQDSTLRDTALRECREEIGLKPDDLRENPRYVWTTDAPRFGLKVGVFAAELGSSVGRFIDPSPREVAHVFWLPLRSLASTTRVPRESPSGRREFDAVVYEGHVLWGLTLRVLQRFVQDDPGATKAKSSPNSL